MLNLRNSFKFDGSTDPLNSKKTRRSTVVELEECLNNSFLSGTQKGFQHPQVKSAIGRVSFAVQFEKSGLASIEEAEDAYSKAATSISDVLSLPEVQQNEEGRYWLKLFELHVNKHLHEIVLLADSNKKKPPAHYDRMEEENQQLKDEIKHLKSSMSDLKAELEAYKSPQASGQTKVLDFRFDKVDEGDLDLTGDAIMKKLENAKNILHELKTCDKSIQRHLDDHTRLQSSQNGFLNSPSFKTKFEQTRGVNNKTV